MESKCVKEEKIVVQSQSSGRCQGMEVDPTKEKRIYITWLNDLNSCWLDSSLALITHNKLMRRLIEEFKENHIYKIIIAYDKSMNHINGIVRGDKQKVTEAHQFLNDVRKSVLQFLEPQLKLIPGVPDSAFCVLQSLIFESVAYKKHFDITWLWTVKCEFCHKNYSAKRTKPIITISSAQDFDPTCPTTIHTCICSNVNPRMECKYIEVPPCLIFHFEHGISNKSDLIETFFINGIRFDLTVLVMFKKLDPEIERSKHFITWIRDPSTEEWLKCDNLNQGTAQFSKVLPFLLPVDVYMLVYEANISNKICTDISVSHVLQSSSTNITCVTISDDSDCSELGD